MALNLAMILMLYDAAHIPTSPVALTLMPSITSCHGAEILNYSTWVFL
jgi:hypothetical protein